MKKVKVAIVCTSFTIGGAENMVAQLIVNIDKENIRIYPILTSARCENHLQALVDDTGIDCIYLLDKKKKNAIDKIKIMSSMWKCLKKIKPDIIHTNLSSVIYTIPYVIFHRVKLIHTVHNVPDKDLLPVMICILRFLIRLGKCRLISISTTIQSMICKTYNVTSDVAPIIYNPVDVGKFASTKRKRQDDNIVITNIGRLSQQKNQTMLLYAFANALKRIDNIRLQIVGEGELKEELIAKTKVLGISNYVDF